MTTIKEQVIISRTIRLYNGEATNLVDDRDVVVTKTDTLNRAFIQSKTVEESQQVSDILFANGEYHNSVTYALFFKATEEVTDEDTAKTVFLTICPTANISYMRLNNDKFSGKLVVDTLADYVTFKSQNDVVNTPIKFYHFNGGKNTRQPRQDTRQPRQDTRQPRQDTRQPRQDTRQPRQDTRQPRQDQRQPRQGQGDARQNNVASSTAVSDI